MGLNKKIVLQCAFVLVFLSIFLVSPGGFGLENKNYGSSGLLGALINSSILSATSQGNSFPLTNEPTEELAALPAEVEGKDYSFGTLYLGNGPDTEITVLVLQEEMPHLWVDSNNDEDLTNDGDGMWDYRWKLRGLRWSSTIQVEYRINSHYVRSPYHINILGEYDYLKKRYDRFTFNVNCHRRGLIELGDKLYPIAINDLNSDGLYNDIDNLLIAVDTDGNNKLKTLFASHELYNGNQPLQVERKLYKIQSISPDGRKIQVQEVGSAPTRPILESGHPAPDFEAVSLSGETITLSNYLDKIVLLIFWNPLFNYRDCNCDDISRVLDRIEYLNREYENKQDRVALIGVATSEILPNQADIKPEGIKFPMIWDTDVLELYRWPVGGPMDRLFVIDKEGIIRAMDQFWIKTEGNRAHQEYHKLQALEVKAIIEDLLKG